MAFDRSSIRNKYLTVTVNGKSASMAVSKMSDAQLVAAMKMGVNKDALADGWNRAKDGSIVRAQSAGVGVIGSGTRAPVTVTGTTTLGNGSLGYINPGTVAPIPVGASPRPTVAPKPGYQWGWSKTTKHPNGAWSQHAIPGYVAPSPTVTTTPTATTPAPPPPPQMIDYRDPGFTVDMGKAISDQTAGLAEQTARRDGLGSLYAKGAAGIGADYLQSRYTNNALLASRGIIRSGEYQRRAAGDVLNRANSTNGLNQQYGSGAQSEIAARIAEINRQYGLSQAAAHQAARDRYAASHTGSYIFGSY